jgi:hypothetical protein
MLRRSGGRKHRYPHPHVPTAQIAVWDAEIAGRACVINPMLRLDHIVALLTAARAKIAVILGENGDIDIWRWYPRFGKPVA